MPVSIFNEISKTGNLQLLIISGRVNRSKLSFAWSEIMNQFVNEFGINKSYQDYLNTMLQVVALNYDIYVKGQKWKKIKALSKTKQAESFTSAGTGISLSEQVANISKQMGFRVDPDAVSVFEFYGYIKHLNNGR